MENNTSGTLKIRFRRSVIVRGSAAPGYLWHWVIMLDEHFFDISKQSFDSVEACVMSAATNGLKSLRTAKELRAEGKLLRVSEMIDHDIFYRLNLSGLHG